MTLSDFLSIGTLLVTAGFGVGLFTIRAQNKKLTAEAHHLDISNVEVFTGAAKEMLGPLRTELKEARAELADAKEQIKELSAEVEHQRQVINETTTKLEAANRRADYYQKAFDERADR